MHNDLTIWKPINTAPRDGREILVTGPAFGIGRGPGKSGYEPFYVVAYWNGGEWCAQNTGKGMYPPTHWMGIPKPPLPQLSEYLVTKEKNNE